MIIRNLLANGLALAIPSPRVCILNVLRALHDLGELCITMVGCDMLECSCEICVINLANKGVI